MMRVLAVAVLLLSVTALASAGVSATRRCDDQGTNPECRPSEHPCFEFSPSDLANYCSALTPAVCDLANLEFPHFPDTANDVCCPSCRMPDCPSPALLPPCPAGTDPSINGTTDCPVCRRVDQCATADSCGTAIAGSTVPECDDGEQPAIDPNTCCPTCRPKVCVNTAHDRDCSTVRDCIAGERPFLLPDSGSVPTEHQCCPHCRPPTTPPAGDRCTHDEFAACMQTIDVCLPGMRPDEVDDDRCCPTCIRQERLCRPAEVARCAASTRTCEANEEPFSVPLSCCPSCIPRPDCSAEPCDEDSICVRSRDRTDRVGRCVPRRFWIMRLKAAIRDAFLEGATCEEVLALLRELGARLCDKPMYRDVCRRFINWYDGLTCDDIESIGADEVEFRVSIADEPSKTERGAGSNFAETLFADSEAMSGYEGSLVVDCDKHACVGDDIPTWIFVVGIVAGVAVVGAAVTLFQLRKGSAQAPAE